jgi:membrane protease YdiL (CAAX protease family)
MVVALFFPSVVTLVYFVILASWPAAVEQTAAAIGKGIQFTLPLFWVLAVQRSRLRFNRPDRAGLIEGGLFGLLVLVTMMVLYHACLKPVGYLGPQSPAAAAILDKVQGFGLDSIWKYIALGTFYSLIHSGLEEYYWRWFVFGQLRRLIPVKWAILVSSIGFMLHHILLLATYFGLFAPATWLFSAAVAIGGAYWAWLYQRTDSLWGPWLSHLLIDAAIFIVGYDLVMVLFTA